MKDLTIKPGDNITYTWWGGRMTGVVTRAYLDRDHDRGVFVRIYEANGQHDERWVRAENINGLTLN